MIIRKALSDDLQLLKNIEARTGLADTSDYFEKSFAEQDKGAREICLMIDNAQEKTEEKAAGFAVINWAPRYTPFKRLDIPEIQDVQIVPEHRQKGYASKLIHYCEQKARDKGYETIGIAVGLHARFGPAQRLYIKLGYAPDGQGITYDRQTVTAGTRCAVDDDLCLMMIKDLV